MIFYVNIISEEQAQSTPKQVLMPGPT